MKALLSDVINEERQFKSVATRVEALIPFDFRVAKYPDGSRRVQGGYQWTEGALGGVVWRDLPMVDVNEHGEAS